MPKLVIVNSLCDPCYRDGEESAGEEVVVAFGDLARSKPQVMLTCERHRKEFYDPLRELLEAFGASPEGSAPAGGSTKARKDREPGPFKCMVEGCTAVPLKNVGSFNAHVRQKHDLTRGAYVEIYGEPQQLGQQSLPIDTTPIGDSVATCPECEKVYSHELGNNRPLQALGVHLARVHGISAESRKAAAAE